MSAFQPLYFGEHLKILKYFVESFFLSKYNTDIKYVRYILSDFIISRYNLELILNERLSSKLDECLDNACKYLIGLKTKFINNMKEYKATRKNPDCRFHREDLTKRRFFGRVYWTIYYQILVPMEESVYAEYYKYQTGIRNNTEFLLSENEKSMEDRLILKKDRKINFKRLYDFLNRKRYDSDNFKDLFFSYLYLFEYHFKLKDGNPDYNSKRKEKPLRHFEEIFQFLKDNNDIQSEYLQFKSEADSIAYGCFDDFVNYLRDSDEN